MSNKSKPSLKDQLVALWTKIKVHHKKYESVYKPIRYTWAILINHWEWIVNLLSMLF